jgi:hypothetical protein
MTFGASISPVTEPPSWMMIFSFALILPTTRPMILTTLASILALTSLSFSMVRMFSLSNIVPSTLPKTLISSLKVVYTCPLLGKSCKTIRFKNLAEL